MVMMTDFGMINQYAFSLLIGLGLIGGLVWILWRIPEEQTSLVMSIAVWGFFGGIAGSRAVYVWQNWFYFAKNPVEIVALPLGGLTWEGAMAGAGLVLLIVGISGMDYRSGVDALVLPAGCVVIMGWLGCWLEGTAYGAATATWYALTSLDEWGIAASRFPLQLLAAGSVLSLTWLFDASPVSRWFHQPGMAGLIYFISLNLAQSGLSSLRADPAPIYSGLRLETWGGLILAAAGLTLLIIWQAIRAVRSWSLDKKQSTEK